jgi:hypothetical protein
MSGDYQIRSFDGVLAHALMPTNLLRDLDKNPDNVAIEALAASGDCFEMIASSLDQIARNLRYDDPNHTQLEHLIRTLLYLQRHHKIIKKFPRR